MYLVLLVIDPYLLSVEGMVLFASLQMLLQGDMLTMSGFCANFTLFDCGFCSSVFS